MILKETYFDRRNFHEKNKIINLLEAAKKKFGMDNWITDWCLIKYLELVKSKFHTKKE